MVLPLTWGNSSNTAGGSSSRGEAGAAAPSDAASGAPAGSGTSGHAGHVGDGGVDGGSIGLKLIGRGYHPKEGLPEAGETEGEAARWGWGHQEKGVDEGMLEGRG